MKNAVITISLIGFLIVGFIRQVNGQSMTNQQRAKIEQQVDSTFHTMVKAGERLDYDLLSKGVDDKFHAGFIVNGTYYAQYDSLIATLKNRAQDGARQNITIQKQKISVLSERVVLLTAFGDSKVELTNGNSFTVRFFWSFVYQKENNQWRVIHSHQSISR